MPTKTSSRKQTAPTKAAPPAPPKPVYQGPWYVIDPQWYEQHGILLEAAVHARRCATCLASDGATRKDARAKGRVSKGKASAASGWEREMHELAEDCAPKQDYMTADTPLVEAVFRTILAYQNRPVAFQELVEEIGKRYAVGEMPKDVPALTLERLLAKQQTYGLKQVEAPKPD